MSDRSVWRRCSACKKPIELGGAHWVCNVSTCNRKRTGLVFGSVSCWEVHLPSANHREAWAVEKTAPRTPEPVPERPEKTGRRRIVREAPARRPAVADAVPEEVLIVASRLKDYVRARAGFNTSDQVLAPLSDIVRRVCDEAIENARRNERKTLLDRDIPKP